MDQSKRNTLKAASTATSLRLEPNDTKRLANLCGQLNEHIKLISQRLAVDIRSRGNHFELTGEPTAVAAASTLLHSLYADTKQQLLTPDKVHLQLQQASIAETLAATNSTLPFSRQPSSFRTKRLQIKARGKHQQQYLEQMRQHDINFGIGPAGTGKTWLAVAAACDALEHHTIERILLVRPAVEAGEKLGFLPGDLADKVDPYLRPLYDALYEMLGYDTVDRLQEKDAIEVAPLAYMRGRTLNHCFVILDEAQNTTREQMKMFLTRIGFGCQAVITGDITQIDLPNSQQSGLAHALKVLEGIDNIGFTYFSSDDIVRHPLVQRIVDAYQQFEQHEKEP